MYLNISKIKCISLTFERCWSFEVERAISVENSRKTLYTDGEVQNIQLLFTKIIHIKTKITEQLLTFKFEHGQYST